MAEADRVPTVPGFTGLTVLARGGYATVFRAVQESVGRQVAIKVESRTLEDERDRRRFLREASAAGRMSSHPYVVDLFDAGVTSDGHPFLIMELCRGSYFERMKTSPLTAVEACDVGIKIADALADAHQRGVLHRDVKPANILITDFGEPVLADFGLAVLSEARDVSVTLDVLTPAYAAPEVFRTEPPTPAVDVYSLCATLYALMAGRPPRWPGTREPSLLSIVDMFADPIPDLANVPAELTALLRAGMSNRVSDRPTIAQVRDALLRIPPGAVSTDARAADPAHGPLSPIAAPSASPIAAPAPLHPVHPVHSLFGDETRGGLRLTSTRLGVAAGIVVILTLAAGAASGAMLALTEETTATFVVSSVSPSREACPLTPAGEAMCVSTPECYDAVDVRGGVARARVLPCTDPHLWETFAQARLPESLSRATHAVVKQNQAVRRVCSVSNVTTLAREPNWRVEVLPPTPEQLAAGDRIYRCLAGRQPAKLTGSRFSR